jgi:TRAP-type C4-dicarboxylate transport system substrate-binding protein
MLALLAGVAFAGGQGEAESEGKEEAAQREVIELRMTAGHPYAAAVWVKTLEDFYGPEVSRRVLEETDRYQVEFKGFYGGSLAKLGEVLEAIESGTADIGITNNIFEQSKLEIHNFSWWPPFASGDLEEVIEANAKVMDRVPVFDEVFANYNMKQLGRAFNMNPSFQLVTNFPIKKLEDLKGKKLAHGGSMIPWLKALGAVGVQSTFTDAYTSIDTGVYQGWAMPLNVAMTFKVYEVANYITIIDLGADISGYVCINLDTWNSLPGEVQKIMDEVGYEYSKEIKRRIEVDLSKSLDVMKEAGCTIYTVEEEERARWAKVLSEAQVAQTQAKKADENGLPGTEVLKEYIKALEETGYTWPWRPAEL